MKTSRDHILPAAGCCATCQQRSPICGVITVALIGQPNCGKSTIFNAVAGYRSATGNFAGTTVRLAWSRVRVNGSQVELVDVPGIYSLTTSNSTEAAAKQLLLEKGIDVIVNVVDASLLSRSLELTLELRELGLPMVVCLNMMDEAKRKGIAISSAKLTRMLEMPVVETIGYRGLGVRQLFAEAVAQHGLPPKDVDVLAWHRDVESVVERLQQDLKNGNPHAFPPKRFVAVKLLEGDEELAAQLTSEAQAAATRLREELAETHGRPADSVVMSERQDRARRLNEMASSMGAEFWTSLLGATNVTRIQTIEPRDSTSHNL
jgi:ferrous iron transport protein B